MFCVLLLCAITPAPLPYTRYLDTHNDVLMRTAPVWLKTFIAAEAFLQVCVHLYMYSCVPS